MRRFCSFIVPLCVLAVMMLGQSAFGAAQLAAGAKTSAAPTSTNPQQRQLQITFDPTFVNTENTADYHLDDFQLSVQYDATKLKVDSIFFVDPFTENQTILTAPSLAGPAFSPPSGQQAFNYFDNDALGLISLISGSAN